MTLIHQLPNEILIFIFAQLNHQDLLKQNAVCRSWRSTLQSNSCWREALFWKWRGLPKTPFHIKKLDIDGRIGVDWKAEYFSRRAVQRTWDLGALQMTSYLPLQGAALDVIAFNDYSHNPKNPPNLFSVSLQSSSISVSNPKTGKIERGVVRVYGEEDRQLACSIIISLSSKGTWVLCGGHDAQIFTVFNISKSVQSTPNWIGSKWMKAYHTGSIVLLERIFDESTEDAFNLAMEQSSAIARNSHILFISVCKDGKMALWSTIGGLVARFIGNPLSLSQVFYFEETICGITADGTIQMWKCHITEIIEALATRYEIEIPLSSSVNMRVPIVKALVDSMSNSVILTHPNKVSLYSAQSFFSLRELSVFKTEPAINTAAMHVSLLKNQPSYLAIGLDSGSVHILSLFSNSIQLEASLSDQVRPISSLLFNHSLLLSGSENGYVYVYDTITWNLLRTLNHQHRNQNNLEERFRVKNIIFHGPFLAISHSEKLSTWTKRPQKARATKTPSVKVPISFGRSAGSSLNGSSKNDLRDDVAMAMTDVSNQRKSLNQSKKRVERLNGKVQDHNMSEQELAEYVQFLSMQSSLDQANAFNGLSEAEAIELAMTLSMSEN
jgi:hypothetical protein